MHGRGGGNGIEDHRVLAHVTVPAAASLALMGLYFSGIPALQAVVAPTIDGLHPFSWREFGALELLQNGVLLIVVCALADSARHAPAGLRVALLALAAGFVFVLLEEIDYGAHVVEYLTGRTGSLAAEGWDRNLHNRVTPDGVQYGSYMRLGATLVVAGAFVVAPLLLHRCRAPLVRLLLPARWMIATTALMALLSWLAHALDDAGRGVIDGAPGNLAHNISEFRELNLYYLFALYAVELRSRLRRNLPAA